MKNVDKIFRATLGFIGTTFDIPVLIVKYILGLIWTAYMFIRGKNAKNVFSKLNSGIAKETKWIIDEFKFYL